MKLRKYTLRQLKEAVKSSTSIRQTLDKLGVAAYGGNYEVIRKAISHFSLDTSRFTGQLWNKGKAVGHKQSLARYLNNEIRLSSYKLKNRLLSEGILERRCSGCKKGKWLGQPIPLELDHINGTRSDNRLSNLRLLCSNCHALTPNYHGKT